MAEVEPTKAIAGEKGADSDLLATARKRFQYAMDCYSVNRAYQLDDLKFAAASPDNGWQWPERIRTTRVNDPNGPRPVLTINKLPQHIRLVTNEQRQNRPSIKVLPVDDKADPETAEVLNGIIRHIEYASDADIAYDTAGELQVKIGEGYVRVLTQYAENATEETQEQTICIAPIRSSFSVYLDPDGLKRDPTGRYCKWGFITDEMQEDEFDRLYPDADPIDWEMGTGEDYAPWLVDGDRIRIAEYFYIEESGEGPAKRTSVKWCKINGFEVLQRRDWAGKFIPVVRMVGNEDDVEGLLVTSGVIRNAKDAQRMYNYMASAEVEIVALAPKAPFVAPAGSFEGFEADWKDANIKNFAYLEYRTQDGADGKPLPAPQRMPAPQPPAAIIMAKEAAAQDLQSTMGQYNPSLGAEASEKSGKAIIARQRQADIGTFHYIDNQGKAIRQLGRIILDLIPKVMDTRRIVRILGEDGEPDTATIDPDIGESFAEVTTDTGVMEVFNPSVGEFDVRVTTGPSYTTKRQEAAEFMAQILQGNKELMGVMGDLYFKMLDVPGAEEIADRIKRTLPPALTAEEGDGEEPAPMVPTPQGPVPIDAAAQLIAQQQEQLMGAQQEMEGVQKAKEQLQSEAADIDKGKVEIKSAIDRLGAAEREFDLKMQLAAAQRAVEEAQAQCKAMGEQVAAQEQATVKAEEQVAAKDGEGAQVVQMVQQLGQGMEQMREELGEGLKMVLKAALAPRKSTIEFDEQGEPVSSTSVVVMDAEPSDRTVQ